MLKVGFVGWRGMVGSVLIQRMMEENDFALIEPQFFTTSQVGGAAPSVGKDSAALKDAKNIADLSAMDAIISCQGGEYTSEIYPQLRAAGWAGHWIDAASTLRMEQEAVIILDPVNKHVIDRTGMQRELEEEVCIECNGQQRIVGLIYDNSTEVGRVHLGIIHIMQLSSCKVQTREDHLEDSGFQSVETIKSELNRLENWSQLCINHLYS